MGELTRSIALVDCNNFYCSCERVFRPDLQHQPVVVLSNNDGAIVSRSNEAKAIGIKMGVPFFQIRDLVRKHKVAVFSSNYALYADFSNRVMSILAQYAPATEVYSIDECFLDLTGLPDIVALSFEIKTRLLRETGIPVCVGIGPTKTLAKLFNFVAKRHPRSRGVFNYHTLSRPQIENVLANIDVGEVWGIGRRLRASLSLVGVDSVLQLRDADIPHMRSRYGVVMEKIIRELRGEVCIDIEEVAPPRQQVICSRSFGKTVTDIADLEEALTHFVSNAALRLRGQQSIAGNLQVFILTDRFRQDQPQYSPTIALPLVQPTADTFSLQSHALHGLKMIYKKGYAYKKAGVILSEICHESTVQHDLFVASESTNQQLIAVMDNINSRYGKGTLRLSQDGSRQSWAMRQERKSPCYTTDWNELPECE